MKTIFRDSNQQADEGVDRMRASSSLEPRGPSEAPPCLPSELGHGPWTWRWFWLPCAVCGDQLQVRRRGGLGSAGWALLSPPRVGWASALSGAPGCLKCRVAPHIHRRGTLQCGPQDALGLVQPALLVEEKHRLIVRS